MSSAIVRTSFFALLLAKHAQCVPSGAPSLEPTLQPSFEPSLGISLEPSWAPSAEPPREPTSEGPSLAPVTTSPNTITAVLTLSGQPDLLACFVDLQAAFAKSAGDAVCGAAGLTDESGRCIVTPTTTLDVDDSSVNCDDIVGESGPGSSRRWLRKRRRLEVDVEYQSSLTFFEDDAEEAGLDTSGDFASNIRTNVEAALSEGQSDPEDSAFQQRFSTALTAEIDNAGGEIDGFTSDDAEELSESVVVSTFEVELEDDGGGNDDGDDDDGLSGGAIAGIVVGSLVGALGIGALAYFALFSEGRGSDEHTRQIV